MTYLEVMTILNVDEADQLILSTENDKVCHVSIQKQKSVSLLLLLLLLLLFFYHVTSTDLHVEKSARGGSVLHKRENTRRGRDMLLFYIYTSTCQEKHHALVMWLQTNRKILA